jgi:hypothetical protein
VVFLRDFWNTPLIHWKRYWNLVSLIDYNARIGFLVAN